MEYCAIRENEGSEKLIGSLIKKEDLVTPEFVRKKLLKEEQSFPLMLIIKNLNQW